MDDFQEEPVIESDEDLSATATDENDGDEVVSDDATTEPVEKKVTFDEDQQRLVNSIEANARKKAREANERARQLEQQLQQIQAQIPQPKAPEIPTIPDRYDFDTDDQYAKALADRDAAIIERAKYDAAQEVKAQQQQQEQLRQQQEAYNKQQELFSRYEATAKSFNIDKTTVDSDAMTLAEEGISRDLLMHIAEDSHGPLIARFLVENPTDRDSLFRMSPMSAAAYIERSVKPKLSGTRKTTQAPKPVSIVSGGGAPHKEPEIIQRAVFK